MKIEKKDLVTEEKIANRLKKNKSIDRTFLELVYKIIEEEKELLTRLAKYEKKTENDN